MTKADCGGKDQLKRGDVFTIAGETGWAKKPDRRYKRGYRLVRKVGPLVRWVVTGIVK